MLAKKYRITKQREFDQFFGKTFKQKKGKNVSSPAFVIKAMDNELKNSRFGIVISNKIDKRATFRNRVRRQIREIIRLNLSKLKTGFDVLIVVQKGAKDKSYQDVEKEILTLFKKAGISTAL